MRLLPNDLFPLADRLLPSLLAGGLVEEFGTKLSRLIDEVKVALEGGEKVIVFSSWARLLQLAGEALADQKIVASSLSGPIDERKHALGTQPLRYQMLSPRSVSPI